MKRSAYLKSLKLFLCYYHKIKGRHALSMMGIDKIQYKWKSSIGGRVYLLSTGIGYIQFECHVKQTDETLQCSCATNSTAM